MDQNYNRMQPINTKINRRGPDYAYQMSPMGNQNEQIKLFDAKRRVDITKPSPLSSSANLVFNSYHSLPVEQQYFRRVKKLEPQSQIAEQVIMSPPRYMNKQPMPIFEKPIVNSLIAPRDTTKNTLFSNVSIYKGYENQYSARPYLEQNYNFQVDDQQYQNTYANAAKSMLRSL